jgi:hypothetical protein
MRPAFSSTKQAAGFALMLLVLLLSPVLLGKRFLPPREEVYSAMTWRYGPFSTFIRQQIFEEKGDVDIAFVGSSRMWAGIDTPYVQQKLSEQLGHPATVITLGWAWLGFDAEYFIARDLLEHRKVKMIVIDDEYWVAPHVVATRWFRYGEDADALGGMPLSIQACYYYASVLGVPKNLLGLLRPSVPEVITAEDDVHWREFFHSQNSNERLGSIAMEGWAVPDRPYAAFTPQGNVRPDDVLVYSPATASQFLFPSQPAQLEQMKKSAQAFAASAGFSKPQMVAESPWQLQFTKQLAGLAREHGTKLVFLHLCPVFIADEPNTPVIQERECWPEVLGTNVSMMGIPPAKLFSGLSELDIAKLFFGNDHFHFSKNGQQFFTRVITPTLIQIYESRIFN